MFYFIPDTLLKKYSNGKGNNVSNMSTFRTRQHKTIAEENSLRLNIGPLAYGNILIEPKALSWKDDFPFRPSSADYFLWLPSCHPYN